MAKASKPLTKSQIVTSLSETAGITKKQAAQTLEALVALTYKNAKNSFTIPCMGKLVLWSTARLAWAAIPRPEQASRFQQSAQSDRFPT